MAENYSFFSNKKCEYFPCHKVSDEIAEKAIKVLFCYCPLYLKEKCPGNPVYFVTANGEKIKDCSKCTFPHRAANYEEVLKCLMSKDEILEVDISELIVDMETENESGSAAVSEEQNLSGTDPAGSGEQSTSGGEQTGAAENNTGTAQTDPAPGAEPSSAPGTASGSETAETAAQVWQEYTVQKGDSLSKISERYYGTMSRVKDICELNQIAVEDLIYAGQKIYLPK